MVDKKTDILCIVESPNKVATLTKIFKDGGYKNIKVMASVGHITEIKDGGSYWNTGIDPKNSFKTNYGISNDKKEIVKKLSEAIKKSDLILLATDPDREGELISWHLKYQLKISEAKYKRITFHEITKEAVLKALDSPRKIDEDLVKAAKARGVLDKLLGYRLTPIARDNIKVERVNKEKGKKPETFSVGRCQSAGLKLITDREKEITDFKPEKYFDLYLSFEKNKKTFKAKYFGTKEKEIKRIESLEEINKIKAQCTKDYVIESIKKKEVNENPKPPFTTSTFQQEANKVFGMSIDAAMSCAQKLFEGISLMGEHVALITYIRTDDDSMSPEFAENLAHYVKLHYGEEYYAPVKKGAKSDAAQEAHECLRVINLNMTPTELSKYISDKNLIKIYRLIWLRTVQSSMAAAKISLTAYNIENNMQLFSMTSREIIFDGYRKVFVDEEDKISDDELVRETFKKGEKLLNTSLKEEEKSTNPPPRYTEATFIKELDKRTIGRPSTYATIIQTILSESRGYCRLDGKSIVPTPKGMKLSEFLDKSFPELINLNYTSELEGKLDLIAKGEVNNLAFLTDFYNKLEDSAKKVHTERICPECGSPLVKRIGKFGPFFGCSNYPKCKHIEK